MDARRFMTRCCALWTTVIGVAVICCGAGPAGAEEAQPAHVSVAASSPVAIGARGETDLIAAVITTTQPKGVILVLATVQLAYTGTPTSKTVEVWIVRGSTALDSPVTIRVGTAARAVSETPVTLHSWDVPGAGPHRYVVRARSSDSGVQATARRLTLIEFEGS